MRLHRTTGRRRRRVGAVIAATGLLAPFLAAAAPASAESSAEVVLNGLDNPRGVAIAANGTVYVAEAGTGGDVPGPPGEDGPLFLGNTGRIVGLDPASGASHTVVSGLFSAADEDGSFALGVAGLGTRGSTLYAIMGESSDVVPPGLTGPVADLARSQLGRLLTVTPSGQTRTAADVGAFDYAWTGTRDDGIVDGVPGLQDSNPYGVLVTPAKVLVADAGANTITGVRPNGTRSIDAVVPQSPTGLLGDAVPTCVAPNGAGGYWVGTLDGQVIPWDGSSLGTPLSLSGDPLFTVGGCTSDGHGGLYATDQASFFFGQPGSLVHVSASGEVTTVLGDLFAPAGVAMAADGHALYVVNNSVAPGGGQLIRVMI